MTDGQIDNTAAALLRSHPELVLTVRRLHRALTREPEFHAIGYTRLLQRLHARSDLFVILDVGGLPWYDDSWTAETREAYREAMERAGVELPPSVVLRDRTDAGNADTVNRLDASLLALWATAHEDPTARSVAARALSSVADLRRALRQTLGHARGTPPELNGSWRPASPAGPGA